MTLITVKKYALGMPTSGAFRCYVDESEADSTALYVVGGFVGRAEVWDQLEPEWVSCLPVGISVFHTTDCFAGEKTFKELDIPERVEVLDCVTDVLVAHDVRLIGYGIDSKTYQRLAPKAKQNQFLGNKYAAAFGGAVDLACHSMGNLPTPDNIWTILEEGEQWEQCAFLIEESQYSASAKRTIADMRICRDLWFRNRIGKDSYGDKRGANGIPLLQVADFGVFLATKHISDSPEGRISWRTYYDKLAEARKVYRMVQADEYSLNVLHQTHDDLKREAARGKDIWNEF